MMNKRDSAWCAALALLVVLLSGCTGGLRSETIVIPDTDEIAPVGEGNASFEVKKIYRIPVPGEEAAILPRETGDPAQTAAAAPLLGWQDDDTVIGVFWSARSQSLATVRLPFESAEKLPPLEDGFIVDGISPDGRYVSGTSIGRNGYSMDIYSISDRRATLVEAAADIKSIWKNGMTWSDNSRYVSYAAYETNGRGELKIGLFDTEDGNVSYYTLSDWNERQPVRSVKISDDGRSALIVCDSGYQYEIVAGTLSGSELTVQYKHESLPGSQAAWINDDQIAYVGTDGTLFTYDLRNAAVSVLLEQVGSFQLSPDRKSIAYSTMNGTIYAGKMQGNNITNKSMVYQGAVPSQMAWSPDSGKLLFEGRKPYEWDRGQSKPVAELFQSLVIEFQ